MKQRSLTTTTKTYMYLSLRYDADNMKHATHIFIHEQRSLSTDSRSVVKRKCDGHDIFVDDNRCASFDYLTF